MKLVLPFAVGIASVSSMVVLMLQTPGAAMGGRTATAAMSGAVVIVFALVLAGASADAVSVTRPRIRPLVDALPSPSRRLLGLRRVGAISAGASAGVAAGYAVGLCVAAVNESPASWQSLVLFPLFMLFIGASAAVGWAAGAIVPSWFVPPALVVASYGLIVTNLGFARTSLVLFGGSPPTPSYTSPSTHVYAATAGFFAALLVLGIAGIGWWARGRHDKVATCLTGGAGLLLAVTAWWMVGVMSDRDSHEWDDPRAWPCVETETGSRVTRICIPPDQTRDAGILQTLLPPLQASLMKIDPELGARTWLPMDEPAASRLVYRLPMGTTDAAEQAEAAVYGLADRCAVAASAADNVVELDRVFAAAEVLHNWLIWDVGMPGSGGDAEGGPPPTIDEAQSAYRVLSRC